MAIAYWTSFQQLLNIVNSFRQTELEEEKSAQYIQCSAIKAIWLQAWGI